MSRLQARDKPDLERVWKWFQFQLELLSEARSYLLSQALGGVSSGRFRRYEQQFVGLTVDQVEAFFTAQQAELEMLTTFELLASVEATLRLDLLRRVRLRKRDPVARKFRALKDINRARLDGDLLEIWSEEAGVDVRDFRGILGLRDWLAHGRYWLPKLGRYYDAAAAYRIATELVEAISLH